MFNLQLMVENGDAELNLFKQSFQSRKPAGEKIGFNRDRN
jgi:hypothetical protein